MRVSTIASHRPQLEHTHYLSGPADCANSLSNRAKTTKSRRWTIKANQRLARFARRLAHTAVRDFESTVILIPSLKYSLAWNAGGYGGKCSRGLFTHSSEAK